MIKAFYGTDSVSAQHYANEQAVPYTVDALPDAIELACSQSLFGPAPRVCVSPADKLTAKDIKLLQEHSPRIGEMTLAFTTKTLPAAVKKARFITSEEYSFPKTSSQAKDWVTKTAAALYGITDLTPDIVSGLQKWVVRYPDLAHTALRMIKHLDAKLRPAWQSYMIIPAEEPPIWKAMDHYTAGNVTDFVSFITDDNPYQLMSMVASRTALLVLASQSPNYPAVDHGVNSNTWSSVQRLARQKPAGVWENVHKTTMKAALDLRTTGITPAAAQARLLLAAVEVNRLLVAS